MSWRSLAGWAIDVFGILRELEEHRVTLKDLQERVRSLEETLKLIAQKQEHRDEVAVLEREKLLLRIESEFAKRVRTLPAPRRKKSK